jgi:hypothetical protein
MFKSGYKPWNAGLTKENDERVRKIAEMKIGKKRDLQTIKKISEMLKGKKNPNFGKHHSPETRRRISEGKLIKKNPEEISDCHEQILIGSILGDANLSRGNGVNFYLEETHSPKQRDYLLWKSEILKILGCSTQYRKFFNQDTGKNYKSFRLKTKSYPILTEFRKKFYPSGKKAINVEVLEKLNELGVTVWFLDDGHVTIPESLVVFSTDSFTYDENVLIQKFFEKKWNIHPKVGKRNGKYYYLSFNANDSLKFLNMVKEVCDKYKIPASMYYKLGKVWEGNTEKIMNAKLMKYIYKRKWRDRKRKIREKEKLKKLRETVIKIKKLYWEEGLHSSDVGRIMGYSGGGIRKIMKKNGIPIRTASEAHLGERNGFYGRRHSAESKMKMSQNRWGK